MSQKALPEQYRRASNIRDEPQTGRCGMNTVEINLPDGTARRGTVKVNGHDVSKIVRGFTVHADAGGDATSVALSILTLNGLDFTGEAEVVLDPVTTELLQRLGWTPPDPAVVLPVLDQPVERDSVSLPPG